MNSMNDDKAFATWALMLITGAGTLLTALVLTGVATLPSLGRFLPEVALGLSVRFAYKWVGGFDWADWSVGGDPVIATAGPAAVAEEAPEVRRAA